MLRLALRLCAVVCLALAGYLLYVAHQIEKQSAADDARAADVIIVMGAAEYRGRPSPVFESRLNHGLMLYSKGLAPYLLTTGGAGGDPHFTEGDVGRSYLAQHGVRSEAIITENEAATTAQSAAAAAETMARMNLRSCIVVSDGYHIYRVKRLLEAHGLKVYGSPRPSAIAASGRRMQLLYLKQAVGFVMWQMGINV